MYLGKAYGDCIGFRTRTLRKVAAKRNMLELVFRGSNVSWLLFFLIKAPKFNGCDSRRLGLGKRLPLCPNGTFPGMRTTRKEQLRKSSIWFWQFLDYCHFSFLAFLAAGDVRTGQSEHHFLDRFFHFDR